MCGCINAAKRSHQRAFYAVDVSLSTDSPTEPASSRPSADGLKGRVAFQHVTKRFRKHTISKSSYTTVKSSFLARLFGAARPPAQMITAVRDLSFEVEPGKAIGIIGRNGSGKSSMLKLIAGIYLPETGSVEAAGRISALIELGAGFHPDFSGRENILLGGVMYGLSKKEIEERFDSIVEYAQLEDFIDDPVRTYSSGMYMRLGFSLAVHTDPDILLIDEVLAVGDAAFIHRCRETISDFRRRGKTMVLVTHDLDSVERWCDEALWLDAGQLRMRGEPRRVIDAYLAAIEESEEGELERANSARRERVVRDRVDGSPQEWAAQAASEEAERWGTREVEILDVQMSGANAEASWLFHSADAVGIGVDFQVNKHVADLTFGVALLRSDGTCVHGTNTDIDRIKIEVPADASFPLRGQFRYQISRLGLLEGNYYLDVAAHGADGRPYDYHHRLYRFAVRNPKRYHGSFVPDASWSVQINAGASRDSNSAAGVLRVNQ